MLSDDLSSAKSPNQSHGERKVFLTDGAGMIRYPYKKEKEKLEL